MESLFLSILYIIIIKNLAEITKNFALYEKLLTVILFKYKIIYIIKLFNKVIIKVKNKEDTIMERTMKTAVMLGIGKMGFEERDIPKVKDNEVLVKLEYVGICGSDLHYYETGAIGDYVV